MPTENQTTSPPGLLDLDVPSLEASLALLETEVRDLSASLLLYTHGNTGNAESFVQAMDYHFRLLTVQAKIDAVKNLIGVANRAAEQRRLIEAWKRRTADRPQM